MTQLTVTNPATGDKITDLPADAQRKLLTRKGARARLRQGLDLLGPGDVI